MASETKIGEMWTQGQFEVRPAPYGYDIWAIPRLVDGAYDHGMKWCAAISEPLPVGNHSELRIYPSRDECRANAALFAAAPCMAKALASIAAKARALSEDKSNTGAERGLWAGCADEADAALRKARGETALSAPEKAGEVET